MSNIHHTVLIIENVWSVYAMNSIDSVPTFQDTNLQGAWHDANGVTVDTVGMYMYLTTKVQVGDTRGIVQVCVVGV